MKLERIIEILEKHQEWRRGQGTEMQNPIEIGTALDYALTELKKLRLADVISSVCDHDFTDPIYDRDGNCYAYKCQKCGEEAN